MYIIQNFLYKRAAISGIALLIAVWLAEVVATAFANLIFNSTDITVLNAHETDFNVVVLGLYYILNGCALYGVLMYYFLAPSSRRVAGITAGGILGVIYSAFFIVSSVVFGQAHVITTIFFHPLHFYYHAWVGIDDLGAGLILTCITAIAGYCMGAKDV